MPQVKVLSPKMLFNLSQDVLETASPCRSYQDGFTTWDTLVSERYAINTVQRSRGYFLTRERVARIFAEKCAGITCILQKPLKVASLKNSETMLLRSLQKLAHRIRTEKTLLRASACHLILHG